MIFALLLAAQTAKLPDWTPLPMQGSPKGAVMAPINAIMAGIAARDAAAILVQTRSEGGATVVADNASGGKTITHRTWTQFVAGIKPGPERYEEILSDPAIEIDGDIAMVWARYVFRIDGNTHHCGVDHFDLVREQGAWKVLNITWSSRTAGCNR